MKDLRVLLVALIVQFTRICGFLRTFFVLQMGLKSVLVWIAKFSRLFFAYSIYRIYQTEKNSFFLKQYACIRILYNHKKTEYRSSASVTAIIHSMWCNFLVYLISCRFFFRSIMYWQKLSLTILFVLCTLKLKSAVRCNTIFLH